MVVPSLWMSSESACKELNIVLFVLPPKNPKYNGEVERGNRIFRDINTYRIIYEFLSDESYNSAPNRIR
jgi:hypothetical protein